MTPDYRPENSVELNHSKAGVSWVFGFVKKAGLVSLLTLNYIVLAAHLYIVWSWVAGAMFYAPVYLLMMGVAVVLNGIAPIIFRKSRSALAIAAMCMALAHFGLMSAVLYSFNAIGQILEDTFSVRLELFSQEAQGKIDVDSSIFRYEGNPVGYTIAATGPAIAGTMSLLGIDVEYRPEIVYKYFESTEEKNRTETSEASKFLFTMNYISTASFSRRSGGCEVNVGTGEKTCQWTLLPNVVQSEDNTIRNSLSLSNLCTLQSAVTLHEADGMLPRYTPPALVENSQAPGEYSASIVDCPSVLELEQKADRAERGLPNGRRSDALCRTAEELEKLEAQGLLSLHVIVIPYIRIHGQWFTYHNYIPDRDNMPLFQLKLDGAMLKTAARLKTCSFYTLWQKEAIGY